MIVYEKPICYDCAHFQGTGIGPRACKAFPEGIPDVLFMGESNKNAPFTGYPMPVIRKYHTEPYPGDNDIMFERVSYEESERREKEKLRLIKEERDRAMRIHEKLLRLAEKE
jgi:hypothetical protein